MERDDLMWLAGLLEGEGSFVKGPPSRPNSPVIKVEMCDEEVITRIKDLFGTWMVRPKPRGEKWSQSYVTMVRGSKACALMRELRPLMSAKRREQIDNALASYDSRFRFVLTSDQEEEIRQSTLSGAKLATKYNVSPATISRVRKRGALV